MAAAAAGCGDDDLVTEIGNLAPVISITTSQSFGVVQLSTFALSASVNDANADPVTVTWSFSDGSAGAGVNLWRTFTSPGTIEVTASATDRLGLTTVSNTITLTIGTASGDWSGTIDLSGCEAGEKPFSARLTQSAGRVTGTISLPEGLCTSTPVTANILTDDDTRVFGSGFVRLHAPLPAGDAWFEGQIDTTDTKITGTLKGLEPADIPFTLNRE